MNKVNSSLLIALIVVLASCYVSKKTTRPVNVSVNTNFLINIEKDPKGHFVDYYTVDQYKEQFIAGLTSKLKMNNITIVNENPEFIIEIEKIVLVEKMSTDTVKDPKSVDKGKVYEVTYGEVKSYGKIRSADNSKSDSFDADKSGREKLTNFFRPGEKTADGRTPTANDWKKKAFDSHEYRDMVNTVGYRTGDVITNRVNKFIKK